MAKKRKLLLFRGDKPLWIIVAALFLVSLLVVYSATAAMAYREVDGNTSYYLFRQARFIMVGFFVIIVVHWIDYKYYARYAKALFKLSIVLVLLAYVIGISLNEASRWIKIPGTGLTFQPSELLKVTLVMVLAQQLGIRQGVISKIPVLPPLTPSGWARNPERSFNIWYKTTQPLIMPIVISTLVILPANFSTAAILWLTCMIMLMIGRVRQRELNRLNLIAGANCLVLVAVMYIAGVGRAETWVNRLTQFAGSTEVVADNKQTSQDSFQAQQAEIAIASGGVVGKGPGNSTQRSQLPHPYSDFAYAFIIEEYGVVGGIVVFVLYLWIFYRAGMIVRRCNRPSQGLMVLGLSLIVTMQAFVNMAVSVGLMPVTGQPLPLISLGGSSVFFTCIAIGMILGVSRESEREQQELEAQQRREALIAAGEIPPDAEPVETAEAAIPTGPVTEPDSEDYAPSVPPAEYETVPQEAGQPQEPAHTPLSRPLVPRHPRTVAPPAEEDEPEEEELTLVDHGVHAVGTTGSATGRREVVDLMDDEDHER
ncbi:FtsW/RodA/SpoVE family cell cycle protein [Millionella massiliensis]|uniref:FtsW/RodA/SpoVE family cell cycle protein n=1 Tax=Millionella massiliensis TaxID=1871023 RepID=UPI0024B7262B|nr:FtsW/RodA/SpoVE family cell cycle protein [Millionella massiliensis]